MDKSMETLDNIEIKLYWLHWKNTSGEYLFLFIRLLKLCSASATAVQTVFTKSSYESTAKRETCQIFKKDELLVQV